MGLAVFLTDENTEGVYRQNDYIRRKSQESGLYKHLIHPEGDEWNGQRLQKLMIIDPDSPASAICFALSRGGKKAEFT